MLVYQELTQKNEYMYAVDWQHPGYWITPRLEFPKSEFNEWTVPIFPNGDYWDTLGKRPSLFLEKN
ncbi:uncharacterized protein DUF2716 [Paenisporosarcina sp. OV554]|nr:uncharacterized protein DUF2716 [Paenisporosarcina sp. OV554]